MNKLLLSIAALPLAGCVGFGDMDRGLTAMNGRPVSEVFALIGYPQSQGMIAGKKVYAWGTNFSLMLPTTSTVNAVGVVGTTPYQGWGTVTSMQNADFHCSVRVFVDENELVETYDYDGNLGGCEPYMRMLKKVAKP